MTLSRNHHVVPQFYLKRFANSQLKIRQMTKTNRAGHLVAVKRATVEADFYSVRTATGAEHDGWERVLSRLEAQAARVAQDVVAGAWPLNDSGRLSLVNWIAAQYLRTPALRTYLDESLEAWRAGVEAGGVDAIRRAVDRADLTDDAVFALWRKGDEMYPRATPQANSTQLRWFIDLLPGMAKSLYERRWILARFGEPSLLTADNAVIPIDDRDSMHPLAAGARVVSIALSRHHLLQLVDASPHTDVVVSGDSDTARAHNAMAMHNAHRFVFQHPSDHHAMSLWDTSA